MTSACSLPASRRACWPMCAPPVGRSCTSSTARARALPWPPSGTRCHPVRAPPAGPPLSRPPLLSAPAHASAGGVFLDSETGDLFAFSAEAQAWLPAGNVGLLPRDVLARQRVTRYAPRERVSKQVPRVFRSKLHETVCRIVARHTHHYANKDMGAAEFLVPRNGQWLIDERANKSGSARYVVLAESDLSPEVLECGNSLAVQFHLQHAYPPTLYAPRARTRRHHAPAPHWCAPPPTCSRYLANFMHEKHALMTQHAHIDASGMAMLTADVRPDGRLRPTVRPASASACHALPLGAMDITLRGVLHARSAKSIAGTDPAASVAMRSGAATRGCSRPASAVPLPRTQRNESRGLLDGTGPEGAGLCAPTLRPSTTATVVRLAPDAHTAPAIARPTSASATLRSPAHGALAASGNIRTTVVVRSPFLGAAAGAPVDSLRARATSAQGRARADSSASRLRGETSARHLGAAARSESFIASASQPPAHVSPAPDSRLHTSPAQRDVPVLPLALPPRAPARRPPSAVWNCLSAAARSDELARRTDLPPAPAPHATSGGDDMQGGDTGAASGTAPLHAGPASLAARPRRSASASSPPHRTLPKPNERTVCPSAGAVAACCSHAATVPTRLTASLCIESRSPVRLIALGASLRECVRKKGARPAMATTPFEVMVPMRPRKSSGCACTWCARCHPGRARVCADVAVAPRRTSSTGWEVTLCRMWAKPQCSGL